MNNCTFIGRLTKDPEIRYTKENMAVCSFTIAVDRYNGTADFFPVKTWGKTAENCAKYLAKGRLVAVNGSMQNDSWEKDGEKHTFNYLNAQRVEFLERAKKEEAPTQEAEAARQNINNVLGINATFESIGNDDIPF